MSKGPTYYLICGCSLLWLLLSFRFEILPLALVILALPLAPFIKRKKLWGACALALVFAYPLSPIALTYIKAESGPKLVGHCNIRGPQGFEGALEEQKKGACVIASDIASQFEADKYIVW